MRSAFRFRPVTVADAERQRTGVTKLQNIRIDEVSGVDTPANLADGWIIQKALQSGSVSIGDGTLGKAEATAPEDTEAAAAPELPSIATTKLHMLSLNHNATSFWMPGSIKARVGQGVFLTNGAVAGKVISTDGGIQVKHPTQELSDAAHQGAHLSSVNGKLILHGDLS